MRIPGLRTGLRKNPVGFAVRAALNDKSGSSSARKTKSISSSRKSYSSYSGSSSYSGTGSKRVSSTHSTPGFPATQKTYKDIRIFSGDEPEILLNEGLVWVSGSGEESRKRARQVASNAFKVPNNEDVLIVTRTKRQSGGVILDGIEVEVDIPVVLESLDNKRKKTHKYHTEEEVSEIYDEYRIYDYKKHEEKYEKEYKEFVSKLNRIRHHKSKINSAIENVDELKAQIGCIEAKIRTLKNELSQLGIFDNNRKKEIKEQILDLEQEKTEAEKQLSIEQENTFGFASIDEKEECIHSLVLKKEEFDKYRHASEDYIINYVSTEKIYHCLLDEFVINILFEDTNKKEFLLKDYRISKFLGCTGNIEIEEKIAYISATDTQQSKPNSGKNLKESADEENIKQVNTVITDRNILDNSFDTNLNNNSNDNFGRIVLIITFIITIPLCLLVQYFLDVDYSLLFTIILAIPMFFVALISSTILVLLFYGLVATIKRAWEAIIVGFKKIGKIWTAIIICSICVLIVLGVGFTIYNSPRNVFKRKLTEYSKVHNLDLTLVEYDEDYLVSFTLSSNDFYKLSMEEREVISKDIKGIPDKTVSSFKIVSNGTSYYEDGHSFDENQAILREQVEEGDPTAVRTRVSIRVPYKTTYGMRGPLTEYGLIITNNSPHDIEIISVTIRNSLESKYKAYGIKTEVDRISSSIIVKANSELETFIRYGTGKPEKGGSITSKGTVYGGDAYYCSDFSINVLN